MTLNFIGSTTGNTSTPPHLQHLILPTTHYSLSIRTPVYSENLIPVTRQVDHQLLLSHIPQLERGVSRTRDQEAAILTQESKINRSSETVS